jgi:hypothetical protein
MKFSRPGANSLLSLRITELRFILSNARGAEVKITGVTQHIYLFGITCAGIAERTLRVLNRIKNRNMDLLFCSNDHIEKDSK